MAHDGFWRNFVTVLSFAAAALFAQSATADQEARGHDLVSASYSSAGIVWALDHWAPAGYGLQLTVSGPDGWYVRRQFGPGVTASFSPTDNFEIVPPVGSYTYELKLVMTDSDLMIKRSDGQNELPNPPVAETFTGSFRVTGAAVTGDPSVSEAGDTRAVETEDLIVQANLCVGLDCSDLEAFGNDIIRLKENNMRIHFDDTSSSEDFPANDWRIIVNDSTSGGANKFSIEDTTAEQVPFTIEAGAPDNALYLKSDGDVGIGTSTPVFNLHVVDGNTPTLRLEQDGSSTFTPQTWDIAGNESNFYIKDATSAGNLVFRIQAGAPENSIFVESTGDIGIGTNSPSAALHIRRTSTQQNMLLIQPAAAGDPLFMVSGSGNAYLLKVLSEGSDRNNKKNIGPVDTTEMLRRVVELPVATWTYKSDDDSIRHMGPMAQDFYANFGLGTDDRHIAPMDGFGVTLAAIQELQKQILRQDRMIKALQARACP